MRHNRRARTLIAALSLTGALGLAACGGDDSEDTATGAESATPSSMAGESSTDASASDGSNTSTSTGTGGSGTSTTMGSSSGSGGSGSSGKMAMSEAFGPGCSQVPASGAGSFSGMAQAPAATAASNNPLLSTLVQAVSAAGLVDTLNGPGPFTIFAPANPAFEAVDPAALNSALSDPKGALTDILTYHVVAGEQLDAAALSGAGTVETVQGGTLQLSGSGESLTVNGASVLCGNVQTANATVHIIDEVLMPTS